MMDFDMLCVKIYCSSYDEKEKPDLPSFVAFNSSFWNGLQNMH